MSQEDIKKRSLKSQGAWLLFAKIFGFAFTFILPLLIVRYLNKEQFGLYRQAFIVVMNAVGILPLGFAMSAYYYLSRSEEKRAASVLNILLFNFVVGGLAFAILFFYPQLLGSIFNSVEMTNLARLIGLAIWIWLFSMFLETVAVANQESILATIFIVFAQFSKTVLMIVAVLWIGTVESIVWAAIIQGAIQTIILLVYLNKRFPKIWTKFSFSFFKEHFAYAIPFGLAGILWIAQVDIHYYFVGNRFGEATLAVYTIGCFQLPLVTLLADAVTSVLIPRMSELQLENDVREMIRIIAKAMQKLAFFYFPAFVFLYITAETFIVTLFTKKYEESIPIFLVFILLLPFHILLSDPIVRAYEKLGTFLLILRTCTFIFMFGALYYGVRHFSLVGIIGIVVGTRMVEMLIAEIVIFNRIGTKLRDLYLLKDIGKIAIVSVVVGLLTFPVYIYTKGVMPQFGEYLVALVFSDARQSIASFVSGTMTLGITCVFYSIVYLAIVYFWGIIEESEKQTAVNIFNKLRKPFVKKTIQTPQSQTFD